MNATTKTKTPKCGIIMPISMIDGCSSDHWAEVLIILKDSIEKAGFEPNLVSDADDSGIIQKRIIHNLYSNEMVVCDVSGKNPNVMFELGMRLAFDKPTIIVKDDKTDYSFDTSVIEHLGYPRDLRFSKIVTFKEALTKKIIGTFDKAKNDQKYTTFLKNFGEYKVAQLVEKEVSSDKFILNAIEDIRNEMSLIRRNQRHNDDILPPMETMTRNRYNKAKTAIEKYIKAYMVENNYESNDLAFNEDQKDLIFQYLETFKEVKNICGSQEILRKIIEDIVDPF